jgi:hypothetical protein
LTVGSTPSGAPGAWQLTVWDPLVLRSEGCCGGEGVGWLKNPISKLTFIETEGAAALFLDICAGQKRGRTSWINSQAEAPGKRLVWVQLSMT